MNSYKRHLQKAELKTLGEALFNELKEHEAMTLTYAGEETLFIRINQSKIRQASEISQGFISMDFISTNRHTEVTFTITGDLTEDLKRAREVLLNSRKECEALPEDPFMVLPEEGESSDEDHYGNLAQKDTLEERILKPAKSCDLVGLYASGILMRTHINSKGQFHWFSTENFYFDYSLYTPSQKAIKGNYAGVEWKNEEYKLNLQQAQNQLKILNLKPRKLDPGTYRVYLAPAAVAKIMNEMSWQGFSEAGTRQGHSPLKILCDGEVSLSPLLSLDEDFYLGLVPRFNEFGEIAPLKTSLIKKGKLDSLLINKRTAKEYDLKSNGANGFEKPRSLKIHTGSLTESNILVSLGTGVYVSNLHYLTWSDLQHGRISGMTRYGCFWVEEGKIVSPIEDMRFDDSIFSFFGDSLEDLTERAEIIPQIMSYGEREIGGISVPGMLISCFNFTL